MYCPRLYSTGHDGYGVDAYAPRPPFLITYQVLRRRLPGILRPMESLLREIVRSVWRRVGDSMAAAMDAGQGVGMMGMGGGAGDVGAPGEPDMGFMDDEYV